MKIHYSEIDKRLQIRYDRITRMPVDAVPYDLDNLYPQRMELFIKNSPTGVRAQRVYSKFLRGEGFENDMDFVINEEKDFTVAEWLTQASNDYSYTHGLAYLINYNGLLNATQIVPVPFKWCRLGWDKDTQTYNGKVYVYEDWEKQKWRRYQLDRIQEFDLYTSDVSKTREQIRNAGGISNWNGHIVWKSKDGRLVYPTAIYDSAAESLDTDAQVKLYQNNEIRNGFHANKMFTLHGIFDDENQKKEQIEKLKNCTGADGDKNLVFEAEENDPEGKAISVESLEVPNIDKRYELTRKDAKEDTRNSFDLPPELMGVIQSTGLSPNADMIMNAETIYNANTREDRQLINSWMQIGLELIGANTGDIIERETIFDLENGTTDS